jgi:hypothetical protein
MTAGGSGTDSPRRLFRCRYDLCPGTALRFPMSVRNAASREITAPMPTFRCLSHSPPPQCCGRPSRVIACSQSRGELDYPPTLPPPQPPNWISLPSDRGILTRTLAKRTGSSRPLARTYATDTGRAQDRGCATGSPSGSYCFPLVFLQIGLRYSFDALDHWSKQLNQSFENAALLLRLVKAHHLRVRYILWRREITEFPDSAARSHLCV